MQTTAVNLNTIIPLQAFRTLNAGLSLDDKKLAIQQALVLFDDLYAHLPLKKAMHAIDPVQRLMVMMQRLPEMGDENEFHRRMLETFNSVQDLHTNYLLPDPYRSATAFLPFMVDEYFDESGFPHYPVVRMMPQAIQQPFEPGVEITHWNGMPMVNAVGLNALDHAGSNPAAQHLQGLVNMTTRPSLAALVPREDWVTLTYVHKAGVGEIRYPWSVFQPPPRPNAVPANNVAAAGAATLGIDVGLAAAQRAREVLFVPESVQREQVLGASAVASAAAVQTQSGSAQLSEDPKQNVTSFPNEIEYGLKRTATGVFGYLRLRSFDIQDVQGYVLEVIRIIWLLPDNGLMIDVRTNPGGNILAGEHLLQLFTNNKIQPEPVQMRSTTGTGAFARSQMLSQWAESINLSVQTGEVFSLGFPLSPETVNAIGRKYFGKVILLTDAGCYSTTDFFCAGFQDHQIGLVLGYDTSTGAGGANVWTQELLRQVWPDPTPGRNPFNPLPKGMSMRVAFRRSLRVGPRAGLPVEDLGTKADVVHRRTRRDVFENDADLFDHAGRLLAGA
jgi:C-terminal processing protease CtpA/Prc